MKSAIETIIFGPERFWRKITGNTYWHNIAITEKRRADMLDQALDEFENYYNKDNAPIREPAQKSDKELCKVILDSMIGKEIRYKDGNPSNYSIDNLELIPIKNSSFEVHDIKEDNKIGYELERHREIERKNAQNNNERLETKLDILEIYDDPDYEKETQADTADTESYAASLPGIDYHDILDRLDEEDIPL